MTKRVVGNSWNGFYHLIIEVRRTGTVFCLNVYVRQFYIKLSAASASAALYSIVESSTAEEAEAVHHISVFTLDWCN